MNEDREEDGMNEPEDERADEPSEDPGPDKVEDEELVPYPSPMADLFHKNRGYPVPPPPRDELARENRGYPPPRPPSPGPRPWPEAGAPHPTSRPMSIMWPASLFILVLLLGVLLAAVSNSDTVEAEPKTEADLEIEEGMVFFQLNDIEEERYLMTISIYITNYGEEASGAVRLNVYAENKFNDIVYDSANKTVDPIEGRKTIEVTIPIELPDNNSFRIRIFLFEAGLIKIQGYGEVSLTDVDQTVVEYTDADDEGSAGLNIAPSDDDLAGGSDDDPGFGVALLIVGTMMAAGLARRSKGVPVQEPRREDHVQ